MINNINTYTNLFNASSSASTSTSEVEEIIAEQKQEATVAAPVDESTSSLFLSSKAQKIDALSREFFSQGELSFDDIDALKERAYELGLISKQDYSRLTEGDSVVSNTSASEDNEPVNQSLVSFISDFLVRLDDTDSIESEASESESSEEESEEFTAFKNALVTAKTMLSDVETAKNDPNFKESLTNTLATFKETINADFFESIPIDDRVGLTKTYQAIDIIDNMSPQRLSNDKINQYISIGLT